MKQFSDFDPSSHNDRIDAIRAISKRGYIDDGPTALFHILKDFQSKGYYDVLEWALLEIERLYKIENGSEK